MKRIILTGASDGLGKSFGKLFVSMGGEIVALCRTKPDYACKFIKCDLANDKSISKACEKIKADYNEFDALINCAGTQCIEPTNNTPYEKLENVIKVNTIAPMFLISQLFDLIKKNEADIVNVGSTVGLKSGPINQMGYTTSKWAIRGTSENIGAELKKTPCRVIQFNAGGMYTRFIEKYNGQKISDADPKDWIDPDDMAKVLMMTLQVPKNIEISNIAVNRKRKK